MIGQTISHYRILAEIGAGGMGVVYKAEDIKLDRTVALKFLPLESTRDPEAKARFVHEAKAASALDHPNICTIYEIDETDDGRLFIAMACYEGQMLKERIADGPLPLAETVDIAQQIAQGLAEAHERDIVHRDIKPANIYLTSNGQVKILDFGLAKLAGETRLTKTGSTLGTVAYMSPEQVRGEEVDSRSDIWSLGAVLYEMITGRIPFKGEHEQAVVYSILNEPSEPVTGVRTGVPLELERVITKCLAKDPVERYQTTADLQADLLHLQRTELGQGFAPGPRMPKARPGLPNRGWLGLAAIAIIAVLTLVYLPRFLGTPDEQPSAARMMLVVLPFENLGPPEDEYFAAGMTEEITSRLAAVRQLGVVSRTSALHISGSGKSIRQIGQELGVDYVLEGTVRWGREAGEKDRVRITPQLIRVGDDTHLWADSYDRIIDDIFSIQSEIAQAVVGQLGLTLLGEKSAGTEIRPTGNIEAYQAYLRGKYYKGLLHFTLESWLQAVDNFQRAVELDPEFTRAYAELSKAHARLYFLRRDLSPQRRTWAREALDEATNLAPESPEVRLARGYYEMWIERDFAAALAEFEAAALVLPEDADVLVAKAEVLRTQGSWQPAVDHYERACALSPRDADPFLELSLTNWWFRRYPESLVAVDKAIALAPEQPWCYLTKAMNYWSWQGAGPDAEAALALVSPDHDWTPWVWYWQRVFTGKYHEAMTGIAAESGAWIRLKTWARPKAMMTAFVHQVLEEPDLAHADYTTAQAMLEGELLNWPDDPRYHSSLGIVYAALGRPAKAIREGKRAVELLPLEKDAVYATMFLIDLAHIYTLNGEVEAAVAQLEQLLSIPSAISVPWLRIDPRWDSLRELPAFQQLLVKYGGGG